MQDGIYRPASGTPINTLITLLISGHPQPDGMFAQECDSLWRIEQVALKVKPQGAVYLHSRRRGFLARNQAVSDSACPPVAFTWLQGSASQARPLSQSRPGNDVAVPAR